MPRGAELSDFEKGQIRAFKGLGLSNRDIAERLARSPTVVDNFMKKKMVTVRRSVPEDDPSLVTATRGQF